MFFSAKKKNVFSLVVSYFGCFIKNACNVAGNHRAPLIDIERTGPRGGHLFVLVFSGGDDTVRGGKQRSKYPKNVSGLFDKTVQNKWNILFGKRTARTLFTSFRVH